MDDAGRLAAIRSAALDYVTASGTERPALAEEMCALALVGMRCEVD